MRDIPQILIQEFQLKPFQVQNTIKLIDEGNTIPFIARYRKEITGELNDVVLRDLNERFEYLTNLNNRAEEVKRLIDEQQKLTAELVVALDNAKSIREVEDIYRPYKPKKKTRGSIAREKGLEPLAVILMLQAKTKESIDELAMPFVNEEKGVKSVAEALNGAMDILAEDISDNAEYRKWVRELSLDEGWVHVQAKKEEDSVYSMYYDFKEPVKKIAKHRILAINRGENEDYLSVKITVPVEKILGYLKKNTIANPRGTTSEYVEKAVDDSYTRLIAASIEREVRNEMSDKAEEQAIKIFKENLRNLLLQPPVKGKSVLGLDPAYRTGCKIAVVDETGKVMDATVVYPTPPQSKVDEAKKVISLLIEKHNVQIIAIGNGTASKEAEIFVSDLLEEMKKDVYYMVVSEAGASVYSASKIGTEEFPNYDVAIRSAVSIARRLQDPLAELVKIDPKSIGVGQYQHDMNQKRLGETLGGVVEDCVNSVGVDLNTASPSLLSYVAGINSSIAKNIVEYRETNGRFKSRKELMKVKKLGEKAFLQCAGFLRIPESKNILDNTAVHPESYDAVTAILTLVKSKPESIKDGNAVGFKAMISLIGEKKVAESLGIGIPTLKDILEELAKPGRDPRDELPKPILVKNIVHMEDLFTGMELTGTVRNVADFGAFIDIGVHQDGLVHISELADKFVRHPMDVVAIGDIVKVKILNVNLEKKRISMTMKGFNDIGKK